MRRAKTKTDLPFLSPQAFEDEASLILAEFGSANGQVINPPIPIEEIVEEHYKLIIEYRDLRAEFPEGDVQGAIWFNEMRIAIDRRLVPEDFPAMLGRYRYTVAHELAHWRLHRHLYLRRGNQLSLSPIGDGKPDRVLRSRVSDPKEYQANQLAACILMPREMLKRVWHEWHGNMEPIYLDDLAAPFEGTLPVQKDNRIAKMLLDQAIRPLAEKFEVSPEAMRIRLEGLKLVLSKKVRMLF